MPVDVMLGPAGSPAAVIKLKPFGLRTVLPAVRLSTLRSFAKLISNFASWSVPVCWTLILLSPTTSNLPFGPIFAEFAPEPVTFQPAFAAVFTCWIASLILLAVVPPIFDTRVLPLASVVTGAPIRSLNWLPFTASFEAALISPLATLVTFLLPASIPEASTLGPPAMVRPLLFKTLFPAAILSTVMSFTKASCMPSLVVVLVTLLSPFTFIVSPSA